MRYILILLLIPTLCFGNSMPGGKPKAGQNVYTNKPNVFTKPQTFQMFDNGNCSSTITVNWNNGNKQQVTRTGNCTLTLIAPNRGQGNLTLKLIHTSSNSTSFSVNFVGVKWPNATVPTWSGNASNVDIMSCYYDGTYYCMALTNMS